MTIQSWAAISVGMTGGGPITFDALPAVSDWSFRSSPGGGNTFVDAAGVDGGVNTNTAAMIASVLTTDTAATPGTSANARWNSSLRVLQTRPTGNGATFLMATLTNATGMAISEMSIGYDFNMYSPAASQGHLPGHRVYYSLTGLENSWVSIPSLSDTETAGPLSATISPNWPADSLMYVLWVDDNADAITDPSYTIDNFAVSFPGQPPAFVAQPVGRTNNEYSTVTLSVAAGGTPPLTYQWSKNGTPIDGATASTFVVTNTAGSGRTWSTPTDSGDYTVVVTGSVAPPVTSATAKVLINPDTATPRLEWAVTGTNALGETTVRVRLSEPFADPFNFTNDAGFYWFMSDLDGGAFASPLNGVMVNATEVLLTWEPGVVLDPTKSYTLNFTAPSEMSDRAEVPNTFLSQDVLVFAHSTPLLSMNAAWKFNDSDVYPGNTWMQPGYDDSIADWQVGAAPFDAKRNANGTAGAHCRDTALHNLGPVGTCIRLTSPVTATNTTTYYFRTTFNYSGGSTPTNVLLLITGKSDDGHVVYLNGTELERVGMPAGPITNQNVFASRTVGDSDAQDVSYLAFPASIVNGVNTLAVSMHQVNASSSDATLALAVEAMTIAPAAPAAPQMSIARGPGANEVTISWTGGGSLYQSTDLGTTASWTEVAGATSPHTVSTSGQRLFFRVQR